MGEGVKQPEAMTDSQTVSLAGMKEWIASGHLLKHLFRYEEAEWLTYRMDLLPRPLAVGLLLRLLSRGHCFLRDGQGKHREVTVKVLSEFLRGFMRDYVGKSSVLRNLNPQVEALLRKDISKFPRRALDLSGTPVYLRTDLRFGVRSGGSVAHIAGVLNHLDQFGEKPIFLSTDEIPTVRKDLTTHYVSPENRFWDFKELPELQFNEYFVRRAATVLDGRRVSFLYHRYSVHNFSGGVLAERYRVPWVLEYNGSEAWMNRHWYKPLKYETLSEKIELLNLNSADVVVVVSQPMKEECLARGIESEKILVNPNGVDPDRYSPSIDGSSIRDEYHLDGKIVIGFIGTFGKWHGAEVLAEAFGLLLRDFPDYRQKVRLMMIGDGATMPRVIENLRNLEAAEYAILTGLVPQEKGPEYLAACDILVASHKRNPDGTPFFGSPTKLFEYMAMGKGIVASNLDQIGEILRHDQTAWMVEPGDAESLMLGLKGLLGDPAMRERLGRAARQEVIAKYTWKEHTRRIIEKLKERCL